MRLRIREHLQAVFELAQETIGLRKFITGRCIHVAQFDQ